MLIAERRSLIIQELRENKKVVVSELSRKFDVSEETIRRDLDRLAEEGVAIKGYGGAVLKEQLGMELPFNVRYKMNPEGKMHIAGLAASRIMSGDYILLDASSTTVYLSRILVNKSLDKLTVITNSVENTVTLAPAPGFEIVVTGGTLNQQTMSLMGAKAIESITGHHVDKALLSCNGLDIERGLTEGNDEVARVKQAIIGAADKVILLADSNKFGRSSFSRVCELEKVDTLITDTKPSDEWAEKLTELNIELIYPEIAGLDGQE